MNQLEMNQHGEHPRRSSLRSDVVPTPAVQESAVCGRFFCCFQPSAWPRLSVLLVLSGLLLSGCSATQFPVKAEQCNLHTYINLVLRDYVSSRFAKEDMPRLAVVPFDVPETFAPPGNESRHFGRELARGFEMELHRTAPLPIVELFNRDRWPGKREEFFTGNYDAIRYARAAGYDFVLVGYLEELKNDTDLVLFTKVIDTASQVTVWHAKTIVKSNARVWRRMIGAAQVGSFGLGSDRPELFDFPQRAKELAACTVDRMSDDNPIEE